MTWMFKCPVCLRWYKGESVCNPYELFGVCDWCAMAFLTTRKYYWQLYPRVYRYGLNPYHELSPPKWSR